MRTFHAAQAKATKIMNVVISVMYSEGFWIRAATACKLGNLLFKFLACYQVCCSECLSRGLNRFSLTPKCHMIAHTADSLIQESRVSDWAQNPVATANQMQEDFVGRPPGSPGGCIKRRCTLG